uniref:Galectin n=1 Tax=Meloidogyne floridensis TaxID=298350 RepID=A0A915NIJ3_9BILA
MFTKKENLMEICIKFGKEGNYFIELSKDYDKYTFFKFFVKVPENGDEKCISKIFKNTLEEIEIFNEFKKGIEIVAYKTKQNFVDGELVFAGKLPYNFDEMFDGSYFLYSELVPLIHNGNYFFEMDNEGNIIEINEKINSKNNLIKNLKLREIGKNKFIKLSGEKQKRFLFNEEYYLMNDNLIAEKLIEEN